MSRTRKDRKKKLNYWGAWPRDTLKKTTNRRIRHGLDTGGNPGSYKRADDHWNYD